MIQAILDLFDPASGVRDVGRASPERATTLSVDQLPEPQRSLLAHSRDMTPTLEAFFGASLHLQVLELQRNGDLLRRTVVLRTGVAGRPAEFGAIEIHLQRFAPEPRQMILECWLPLGTILQRYAVAHTCRPQRYFSCLPDASIRAALCVENGVTLYGRVNVLQNPAGEPLARAVEILPPVSERPPPE